VKANMHEAKSNLSQLAERAYAGERIIIAKSGKPFVQLIPYRKTAARKFGQYKGEFRMSEAFDSDATNQEIIDLFEG